MITDEQAAKALETFKDQMWRDGEIPAMRLALSAALTLHSAREAEPVGYAGTLGDMLGRYAIPASEGQVRVKAGTEWYRSYGHMSVLLYTLRQDGWRKGEPMMVNDVMIRIERANGSETDIEPIVSCILSALSTPEQGETPATVQQVIDKLTEVQDPKVGDGAYRRAGNPIGQAPGCGPFQCQPEASAGFKSHTVTTSPSSIWRVANPLRLDRRPPAR